MESRSLLVGAGVAALSFAAGGCGPGTITLPAPPMAAETAALVSTYQMPTAVLDTTNIDQAFTDARATIADLPLDWFPELVADMLTSLKSRLVDGGLTTDPGHVPASNRPQVTAVLEVNRICAGWDNPAGPPNPAANGTLDLTAIVDTGRLNPEAWAVATACQTRVPPAGTGAALQSSSPTVVNATVDGTIIIYLLAPVPSTLADAQFLVTFDGSLGVAGQTKTTSFDFQYVSGSIKVRVPVNGGDAIVTVGPTLGIQGANAGFSCDLTSLTCQAG